MFDSTKLLRQEALPVAFHQQGGQHFNRCRLDGAYHRSAEDGEDGDEVFHKNIEPEHMKQVVSEIIPIPNWYRISTPALTGRYRCEAGRIGRSMPSLLCPDESQKMPMLEDFEDLVLEIPQISSQNDVFVVFKSASCGFI